ncbi:hypothetical protein RHSIM_Rhsim02G0030900 [Rhododendron simsii]|uniref:Uncharacterized protein n=1 Tax=Rhododendron simsii TaxID=118357 RepID=A0A834HEB1_RHOSS|nr:hypothetical protein RHSIM_Rhsim02G0030900 [Rhododendron simsii]
MVLNGERKLPILWHEKLWGKNGQGDEWHEKLWEHYDASGQADKWAHKWRSIDPNTLLEPGHAHVWHERYWILTFSYCIKVGFLVILVRIWSRECSKLVFFSGSNI